MMSPVSARAAGAAKKATAAAAERILLAI
jgi:hypothetical protein